MDSITIDKWIVLLSALDVKRNVGMGGVRIGELSRRSGVSVASVKFYVREGLLPPGTPTAANQASYGDEHLHRLRLIRALVDVGDLSLASVRAALAAVDDEAIALHDAFGEVMHALDSRRDPPDAETVAEEALVRAWLAGRDWAILPEAPAPRALAELIVTLRRFGVPFVVEWLDEEAAAASARAVVEVANARAQPTRAAAVEMMAIGTVVFERVLTELRRLALEAESARVEADLAEAATATSAGGRRRRSAATPHTPATPPRPPRRSRAGGSR
jgi:DNA-binding transcriptional MerR regulator